MLEELNSVVLKDDLTEAGLQPGDIGTIVLVHQGGKAYEVEFMTLEGKTIAVVTLRADQVRAIGPNEIAHVRQVDRMTA